MDTACSVTGGSVAIEMGVGVKTGIGVVRGVSVAMVILATPTIDIAVGFRYVMIFR